MEVLSLMGDQEYQWDQNPDDDSNSNPPLQDSKGLPFQAPTVGGPPPVPGSADSSPKTEASTGSQRSYWGDVFHALSSYNTSVNEESEKIKRSTNPLVTGMGEQYSAGTQQKTANNDIMNQAGQGISPEDRIRQLAEASAQSKLQAQQSRKKLLDQLNQMPNLPEKLKGDPSGLQTFAAAIAGLLAGGTDTAGMAIAATNNAVKQDADRKNQENMDRYNQERQVWLDKGSILGEISRGDQQQHDSDVQTEQNERAGQRDQMRIDLEKDRQRKFDEEKAKQDKHNNDVIGIKEAIDDFKDQEAKNGANPAARAEFVKSMMKRYTDAGIPITEGEVNRLLGEAPEMGSDAAKKQSTSLAGITSDTAMAAPGLRTSADKFAHYAQWYQRWMSAHSGGLVSKDDVANFNAAISSLAGGDLWFRDHANLFPAPMESADWGRQNQQVAGIVNRLQQHQDYNTGDLAQDYKEAGADHEQLHNDLKAKTQAGNDAHKKMNDAKDRVARATANFNNSVMFGIGDPQQAAQELSKVQADYSKAKENFSKAQKDYQASMGKMSKAEKAFVNYAKDQWQTLNDQDKQIIRQQYRQRFHKELPLK